MGIVLAPATKVRVICVVCSCWPYLQPPIVTVRAAPSHATINLLPDDVLLHIFHLDRVTFLDGLKGDDGLLRSWRWDRLVHVCRRWRSIVFASPNFLDLKIVNDHTKTRVELTDIWPPFPIIIRNVVDWPIPKEYDLEAAIVHHNRVYEINLPCLTSLQLERLASAMQE